MRCASQGCRFRVEMDNLQRCAARSVTAVQIGGTHHGVARETSAVALACVSSAQPHDLTPLRSARICNAPCPSPAGEGVPKRRMRGTATRIAHPATAARGTTSNAQCNRPQRRSQTPHSVHTAGRCHRPETLRTGFSSRPSPSRPSVAKAHHTRLRNISWLLLANRRHRRILGQARINHFFYRNPGNSDESSRLVRITNRLNVNFSSWSHQMQTDPTAV